MTTNLSGFNRGYSTFFNNEKLLFCFIKLCKCAQKYKKNFVFFNVRGDAPLSRTSKNKACTAQRISHYIFEL